MADLTITNVATVPPPVQNWLGQQLLVMGQITAGSVPTCVLQNQSTGTTIANGDVYTAGTLWWARFGPLTNVDGSTAYQIVASAPTSSPTGDTSVTIKQLYFTNLQLAITSTPAKPFPLSFQVQGTYPSVPGTSRNVVCRLLKPGTGVVGFGAVAMDKPQAGQWTASFNLSIAQSGCQLEAELMGTTPPESVAATWIDGVNVGS
jgi:hypothetical protein